MDGFSAQAEEDDEDDDNDDEDEDDEDELATAERLSCGPLTSTSRRGSVLSKVSRVQSKVVAPPPSPSCAMEFGDSILV